MKCTNCDFEEFEESDGRFYCVRCQQQCRGAQVEVADEEDRFFVQTREVAKKRTQRDGRSQRGGSKRERVNFSLYSSTEEKVIYFLGALQDLIVIIKKYKPDFDSGTFTRLAIKLVMKYLRESELAYARNEIIDKKVKLHPTAPYRDQIVLNEKNENLEHLPTVNFICKDIQKRDYTRAGRYLTPRETTEVLPKENYYNDQVKQRDPRPRPQYPTVVCPKEAKMNINKILREMAEFKHEDKDTLAELLKDPTGESTNFDQFQPPEDSEEEEDQNEDEKAQKAKKLKRSSKKFQALTKSNPNVSIKNRNNALSIDVVSHRIMITILYMAVRQAELPIFFGDFFRWIANDNIRLLKQFDYLPLDWEIYDNTSKFVAVQSSPLFLTVRNLHVHLSLKNEDTNKMYRVVIERLVHDLNLPVGLNMIIEERYGKFLENYRQDHVKGKIFEPPKYEQTALALVLLALRDLFNLDHLHTRVIPPVNIPNMFDIHAWFAYSQARFNAIAAHAVCLRYRPNHLIMDYSDFLGSTRRDVEYFERHKDKKFYKQNHNKRFTARFLVEVANSYAALFDEDTEFKALAEDAKKIPSQTPSIYPMRELTNYVLQKSKNPYLNNALRQDFTKTVITPYMKLNLWYGNSVPLFPSVQDLPNKHFTTWLKDMNLIVRHFIDDLSLIVIGAPVKSDEHFLYIIRACDRYVVKENDPYYPCVNAQLFAQHGMTYNPRTVRRRMRF